MLAKPAWGAGGFTPLHGTLLDRKQYPDQETPEYIALHELHVHLKDLYKQTFPS
jgi:hypothetical protein